MDFSLYQLYQTKTMAEYSGSVKMREKSPYLLDEDCWEIIFRKLDDSHDIASVSLVSKKFLSITNQSMHSLKVSNLTASILPRLLQRFRQLKSIEITAKPDEDCNGIICHISRSGLEHFEALWIPYAEIFPREGLRELANNMKGLKKLSFSKYCCCRDDDLVPLADWLSTLEELSITGSGISVSAQITDTGLEILASKLKRLKKLSLCHCNAITDQSLVSISLSCANLTDFLVHCCLRLTENGFGFLMRHCSKLTSLSLYLTGKYLSNVENHFTIENSIPYAKNLEEISFKGHSVSNGVLCCIPISCPMVKKIVLNPYWNKVNSTTKGLTCVLSSCPSLRDFTLGTPRLTDEAFLQISQHIRNLIRLDLSLSPVLSIAFFFMLTQTCTSLHSLKMNIGEGSSNDNIQDVDCNYRIMELELTFGRYDYIRVLPRLVSVCPKLLRLCISCHIFKADSKAFTDEIVKDCLRNCPELLYLDISGLAVSNFIPLNRKSKLKLKCIQAQYTNIDDEALEMMGKKCPDLESLDIEGCGCVTIHGLMLMMSHCKRLREINMNMCGKVTIDLLDLLVKSRPSLKKIIAPIMLSEEQKNLFLRQGCYVNRDHFLPLNLLL